MNSEKVKFTIYCYWADGCASHSSKVEASTSDELLKKIEETFRKACGAIGGIESFTIVRQDRDVMDKDYEYDWDNRTLIREEDLSDVWKDERNNIRKFFGDRF